jgi:hypothetical protein
MIKSTLLGATAIDHHLTSMMHVHLTPVGATQFALCWTHSQNNSNVYVLIIEEENIVILKLSSL